MRAIVAALFALIVGFVAHSEKATAAETSETGSKVSVDQEIVTAIETPKFDSNIFGFEGLGKGLLYGLFYERLFSEGKLAVGLSLTYLPPMTTDDVASAPKYFFSPYISVYRDQQPNRFFGTAGFIGTTSQTFADKNSSNPYRFGIPVVGIGWENKLSSSTLLRLTGYAMVIAGPGIAMIIPWVGGSLAKTF